MNDDILNPPAAYGAALFKAVLKKQADDFQVREELDINFSGDGEHLYLQIEKTSMNTDEVVALLQSCFSVGSADIGLSGLKDRHSVSTQWFSVRTPDKGALFDVLITTFNEEQQRLWADSGGYCKSLRLVSTGRHSRKLKRGAHRCNHFRITLHDVQCLSGADVFEAVDSGVQTGILDAVDIGREAGILAAVDTGKKAGILETVDADKEAETDKEAVIGVTVRNATEERAKLIAQHGFPNYIGAQRFGFNGQNLQRARQWFAKPRKRTSRTQRSLWLSAARSAVFNAVCAARVRDKTWNGLLRGEPAALDGSRSFFTSDGNDVTQELVQRLQAFDIHPSAPWWGRGRTPATGECAAFEERLLQPFKDVCEGIEKAGLAQERRPIRAMAGDLTLAWINDSSLMLEFSLAPGVFATTLLREFCQWEEPSREAVSMLK